MELTPEQRELIKKRQVANIFAKLNAGKSITGREQRLLDELTGDPGNYVNGWDNLAKALGVTAQAIRDWRKLHKDCPRKRGDGRQDVNAWILFMRAKGLKRADETVAPGDIPNERRAIRDWKEDRAKVEYESALFRLEVEREKHLPISEITAAVGQMLAGFRTALNTMPSSAARWLIGLRDFNAIKDKLQDEVDAVLQALGRCDYLEALTPTVVAKVFPERDEAARAEIARAVDSVFCELGRLALSDLLQRQLPPSEEPPASRPSDNERKEISPDPIEPGPAESNPSNKPDKSPRKRRKKK